MSTRATKQAHRLTAIAAASIAVAIVVMGIKYVAYQRTGSVALYSDALESVVNLATAIAALIAIHFSQQPADQRHPFGHHKAELLAAVFEGVLVVLAALLIMHEAWQALNVSRPVERPIEGLAINAVATAINAGWYSVLMSRGRAWRSPALVADAKHLLTDVITSLGVFAGVALVAVSGWNIVDSLIAMAVAVNVLWVGYRIILQSMSSLMDEAASGEIQARIHASIASHGYGAMQVHDIRTRHAGRATFIDFHLVVPGNMTVSAAHAICDRLEHALEAEIDGAEVVIHVEPEHKAKSEDVVQI